MINLSETWGFYADTAPMPPLEEAQHDSIYFFEHTRLPGMLAVYETKYTWRPDGRRRNQPTPQEVNYNFASVIIVVWGVYFGVRVLRGDEFGQRIPAQLAVVLGGLTLLPWVLAMFT